MIYDFLIMLKPPVHDEDYGMMKKYFRLRYNKLSAHCQQRIQVVFVVPVKQARVCYFSFHNLDAIAKTNIELITACNQNACKRKEKNTNNQEFTSLNQIES